MKQILILFNLWLKKRNGFFYKTATYFVRLRVVCEIEERYRDMVSIHGFTKRKTEPSSIFVTASEHMRMCSKFGNNGYWLNRWGTSHYRKARLYLHDKHTEVSMVFKDFYSYKSTAKSEYKWLFGTVKNCCFKKLHKFGITLPEGVQVFFVLNETNVSEEWGWYALT